MTSGSAQWYLPQASRDWKILRNTHSKQIDIHRLENSESASKIQVKQFLALKVIWPVQEQSDMSTFFNGIGFDNTLFLEESNSMAQRDAWILYLDALQKNEDAREERRREPYTLSSVFPDKMGPFALVLHNQLEIEDIAENNADEDLDKVEVTPRRVQRELRPRRDISYYPSTPHTPQNKSFFDDIEMSSPAHEGEPKLSYAKDEQIVNLALINFLNAIWINERRNSEWSLKRKAFNFESKGDGADFLARVDGHLGITHRLADRSGAILEVKARRRPQRRRGDHKIEMQESAQMALWIYQEPYSHWTISRPNIQKSVKGKESTQAENF